MERAADATDDEFSRRTRTSVLPGRPGSSGVAGTASTGVTVVTIPKASAPPVSRKSSPSPVLTLVEVPARWTTDVDEVGAGDRLLRGRSRFQAARSSAGSTVSKTAGVPPGSGSLWTGAPASNRRRAGAPGVVSMEKARSVSAANPGRSWRPMSRASSETERRSPAVPM